VFLAIIIAIRCYSLTVYISLLKPTFNNKEAETYSYSCSYSSSISLYCLLRFADKMIGKGKEKVQHINLNIPNNDDLIETIQTIEIYLLGLGQRLLEESQILQSTKEILKLNVRIDTIDPKSVTANLKISNLEPKALSQFIDGVLLFGNIIAFAGMVPIIGAILIFNIIFNILINLELLKYTLSDVFFLFASPIGLLATAAQEAGAKGGESYIIWFLKINEK
jgi:hypothetical protein